MAGFNEAAGIPRGRPGGAGGVQAPGTPASMRPRVFPAEDLTLPTDNPVELNCASMRPRVFPAEDDTL